MNNDQTIHTNAPKEAMPWGIFGLLGSLYLSQGLPYGFFTQTLPVWMRQQGVSLPWIGLSTLLVLPWALKFLWAPWVDRYDGGPWGRRRSWILPLQAATISLLLALAFASTHHERLWLTLVGFLLANLLAATQDIATDALAIDLLPPHARGMGNGVQVAGYRLGMIIGGGPLLLVFAWWGWQVTFIAMAGLLLLASIPLWQTKEEKKTQPPPTHPLPVSKEASIHPPPTHPLPVNKEGEPNNKMTEAGRIRDRNEEPVHAAHFAVFRAFWQREQMPIWLLFLVLYKGGEALATSMLRPMLVDLGLSLEEIGILLGLAGFSAGLLGALAGGFGVQRLGRRRALLFFGLLQAFAVALYLFPAAGVGADTWLYAICLFEHFAGGMATAALFTVMMDMCRPESAASDYTLQASIVVISTGSASALGGLSAQWLGYIGHFTLATALCVLTLLGMFATRLRHRAHFLS